MIREAEGQAGRLPWMAGQGKRRLTIGYTTSGFSRSHREAGLSAGLDEQMAMARYGRDVAIAANLRKLTSLYKSVAEVCRKAGINRQQFNKYLSGGSFPSLRNLRLITDFFGVDEFEILLPPAEFASSVLPRARAKQPPTVGTINFLPAPSEASQLFLAPYCGYYHIYFCTPVWSNHIVRALMRIYQQDGRTLTRTIQPIREGRSGRRAGPVQKFRGIVAQVSGRICIVEYETFVEELLSMTFLYPSHRHALRFLTGVMNGVASGGGRQPFASRIVYEYLGRKIDARATLGVCGLFPLEDQSITEEIRSRVKNDIGPGEGVLAPRPY
jgi:transcriptional regulator with XRE-family HTH domain